jgi:hypothetical protein
MAWLGSLAGRALVTAALLGCGGPPADAPASLQLERYPGYPATTSRLAASLGGNFQKSCHATLVAPSWALTAAHCFAGVEPSARGTLRDFERGFSVSDVELYPGAHVSGETHIASGWERGDFVPAHDLALVPLRPAVTEVAAAHLWRPAQDCDLRGTEGLIGEVGLAGDDGEGWTAQAAVLGSVAATTLLGAGYEGSLLAARGPSVGPGDSGGGLTAQWDELHLAAPGCALLDEALLDEALRDEALLDELTGVPVLLGVVQDANPVDPGAPFGLVPVYGPEHAGWLQSKLDFTPAVVDSRPPRLPP